MATKVKLVADGVVTADQLTLTTASTGTNTTAPATTAFVQQEVAALVDSAPGTLNTLNELAAALGDDANFSTTVTNSIAAKLPLAGGTMTGALNMGSQNITSVNRISTADGISDTGAAGSSTVFNESGSTADFRIESSSNTHMFFLDGGLNRIGVGISSPSSKLHITGTNTTGGLFVEDSSNSAASPVIKVQGKRSDGNKSQSFSGGITLESLYTGGLAPDTKHAGTIYFGINHTDGTAANIAYSASISGILEGAANSASDMPTGLAFYTGNTGTALGTANTTYGTERMRIDSSGNVGIGTDNPNFYEGSGLEIERAGIATLRLQNTTDTKSVELSQDSDFKIETINSSMDIVLYPTGNVGVGHASSPSYKLDVLHSGGATSQVVQRIWNNNTSWQAESLTEYYADSYSASFPRTQIGFYRGDTGDNDSSGFIVKTGTTLANQTTNFKVQADGKIGVGHSSPDSTLHVKGTSQLNLLTVERTSSTPGIKFVNGADTAGAFGFQIMDKDEYWAGANDGSGNYDYWFKGNSSVLRVEKPVASSTDSGTRQYSHLCTGSFYSGTGAIVINTNIPAHDASGNANMFSIKIRGFQYSDGGQIDMNVGCYAGENNYYSATYGGNHVPYQWRDEVHFAENTSTNTVAIILGTTTSGTNYEIAVVDFIQGFINVNESYAEGWTMTRTTDLSGYGSITDCQPRVSSPRPSFLAYLTSNTNLSSGTNNLTLGSTDFNIGGNYNTSNGRFTAPIEGVYQFNVGLQMNSSSTNQRYMSAEVILNGTTRYIGGWYNKTTGANNNSATYSAANASFLIKMEENDYVNFGYELSNADAALGANKGYTYMSGILVG